MDPGSEYTLITVDDYSTADDGSLPSHKEDAQWAEVSDGTSSRGSSTQASPRGLIQAPSISPRHPGGGNLTGMGESGRKKSVGMGVRRRTHNDLKQLLSQSAPASLCGVVSQSGCILISLTTMEMWGTYGFLGKCFAPFQDHGISVDHVATSQSGVSVTLSYVPGGPDGDPFKGLIDDLRQLGTVEWESKCSVVTVVGNQLSKRLPEIGRAMQKLRDVEVLMVSASSEDVAMSFVVRERAAQFLVEVFPPTSTLDFLQLCRFEVFHHELIPVVGGDSMFGSTFKQLIEKDVERHHSLDLCEAETAAREALQALQQTSISSS